MRERVIVMAVVVGALLGACSGDDSSTPGYCDELADEPGARSLQISVDAEVSEETIAAIGSTVEGIDGVVEAEATFGEDAEAYFEEISGDDQTIAQLAEQTVAGFYRVGLREEAVGDVVRQRLGEEFPEEIDRQDVQFSQTGPTGCGD